MKVPASTNQNNVVVNSISTTTAVSIHPKLVSCTTTANTARNTTIPFLQTTVPSASNIIPPTSSSNTNPSSCCYEPTSVLELQHSPSPVVSVTQHQPQPTVPVPDALSVTATANSPSVDLDNLEGWDSILTELGFNEDSTSLNPKTISPQLGDPDHHHHHLPDSPVLSHQHHQFQSAQPSLIPSEFFLPTPTAADQFPFNNNNFNLFDDNPHHQQSYNPATGLEFVDDLLRAAQQVESNDTHNCQLTLARLNNRLRSPTGKPFHRAAYYFKEALNNLLTTTTNRNPTRLSSQDIIQTIRAHKAYSTISPIPLFSTFTANQAILESIVAGSSSSFVHIVDFDIGFGDHWASLMREIAATSDPGRSSVVLRITAVVGEEFAVESRLVTENLVQFARDLNIVNFQIDFVLTRNFDAMSFKAVKFVPGEKIVVRLTPTALNRVGSRGNLSKFVGDLRGLSPNVVVLVDGEVGVDTGTGSFSLNFVAGLDFYAAVLESLDAASAANSGGGGGGLDWVRKVETYLIKPRIVAMVESATAGRKGAGWREVLSGYGMKAVGFSQFADVQAEFLLRRAQVSGFHVAKRQGEMLLCWHERPIVAMSAWRC